MRGSTMGIRKLVLAILAVASILPGTASADEPLRAVIITVEERPLIMSQRFIGTIEPRASYTAAFRGTGRIVELAADTGDVVEAGAVLARLDDTQARLAEAAAAAAISAAEALLEQARSERDRTQERLARGVGTQAQMDEAEEALLAAEASARQAQTRIEVAHQGLEDTVIRASEPSIVISRAADLGEIAGPERPVFTLARADEREALFLVPDRVGLEQFLGRQVRLEPHDGTRPLDATVTEIAPMLDRSGTVAIRATIAVVRDMPPIGAAVEASLDLEGPPRFTIPWTALTATADGPAVWIVDPATGTAQLRPVVVDRYTDTSVIVVEGLETGMRVVGAGSQSLYEGRAVLPVTLPEAIP